MAKYSDKYFLLMYYEGNILILLLSNVGRNLLSFVTAAKTIILSFWIGCLRGTEQFQILLLLMQA